MMLASLAKRKTEKFLFEKGERYKHECVGKYEDKNGLALDHIYKLLGLSAHPSAIGMMMNTADDFSDISDRLVVRSAKFASRLPLNSSIFLTALPFGFAPIHYYEFRCGNLFEPKKIYPPHRDAVSWKAYCRELQKVIPAMFLSYIPFDNHFARANFQLLTGRRRLARPNKRNPDEAKRNPRFRMSDRLAPISRCLFWRAKGSTQGLMRATSCCAAAHDLQTLAYGAGSR